MFGYEWSINLTDPDGSRTWMVDVNTGLRHWLPFRYFDRATIEKSEDGNRVMMIGQNPETVAPAIRGGDLYIISRDTFTMPPYLTDHPGYDGEADAVDNLSRIVFVSDRDSVRDIYTLLLDNEDHLLLTRRLTFDDQIEHDPQWLTREQYHDYLDQFSRSRDTIILNPDEDNLFFND